MAFAIGVFDLFTYGIPGALHLSLIAYVLFRLQLVHPGDVFGAPSVLLLVGGAVLSYLLGHLTYPLSALLDKLAPRWHYDVESARREFVARVPEARKRPFVHANIHVLLAAAELHDKEAATEITRLRGIALMLRNSALAMSGGLVVAVIELFVGAHRGIAGTCALLLLIGLVGAIREGRGTQHFDRLKTLEICFWLPDIDEKFDADHQ